MSREAALRVDIHSDYEYIHESLLNWSRSGLRIEEVALPVLAERPVGESRMMRSVVKYGLRSAPVLIRATRDYSPLKFFGLLALAAFVPALIARIRFQLEEILYESRRSRHDVPPVRKAG